MTNVGRPVGYRGTIKSRRTLGVLWALKLGGDVEENFQGGNATTALRNRIEAMYPGYYENREDFQSALSNCKNGGHVKCLVKGNRTFAIRLVTSDEEFAKMENPFANAPGVVPKRAAVSNALVPYDNMLAHEWGTWPVSQRLELIKQVSQSVAEDVAAFKTGVVDGL